MDKYLKELIDQELIKLSKHANIDNYVIVMNYQTIKKHFDNQTEYKGHKLVYDFIGPDNKFYIVNWDDYAREKNNFNKRIGLHL